MKFKKGDIVKVTYDGDVYEGYDNWAEAVGAKKWRDGNNCNNGDIGKIIAIRNHSYENKKIDWKADVLALININGKEVIINTDGIKLTNKKNMKPEKVNFILKYELEEDPIEEFETMAQVEKRIKELVEYEDLQRDSMVVYEVKSVKKVSLKTVIEYN